MGSYFIDEITANTALQMYHKLDLWFRKYGHYKHCSQTSPVFNASFPELTCQQNSGQEPCQKQGGVMISSPRRSPACPCLGVGTASSFACRAKIMHQTKCELFLFGSIKFWYGSNGSQTKAP
jgi:hypothetical protein